MLEMNVAQLNLRRCTFDVPKQQDASSLRHPKRSILPNFSSVMFNSKSRYQTLESIAPVSFPGSQEWGLVSRLSMPTSRERTCWDSHLFRSPLVVLLTRAIACVTTSKYISWAIHSGRGWVYRDSTYLKYANGNVQLGEMDPQAWSECSASARLST